MTDHGFIDVNAQIGPAHGNAAGATPEMLAAERRAHGIRHSLVRHRNALLAESRLGNRAVLEACERDPGLHPVAVLAPERSDSLDQASGLGRGSPVVAFWLEGTALPGQGGLATDQLVRAAARTGKPLIVAVRGYGDASAVGAATADLGVPVILSGWHYTNSVDVLAAARHWEHLYVETARAAHMGAIEIAARKIGAERLLLGTEAPIRAMQSTLNAILGARIADDAKRAILGGNAARLFGIESGAIDLPAVRRVARAVDVHTHSGPLPWDVTDVAFNDLVPELRRLTGTTHAVSSSILAIEADTEAGNREVVEGCARLTGQVGYLVADPNDLDATRDQIRRWGDAPGIVGIKVHCEGSGRHTGTSQIRDVFRILADYGRPVKIHNDGPDWERHLVRIAREHPRLPIVIAHGGMGFPDRAGAWATVQADNIHLEMSSSFAAIDRVREVVRTVPRHKFLYGTDAPLLDPGYVLGTYQDAQIPDDQQDDVYFGNAARLYGLT